MKFFVRETINCKDFTKKDIEIVRGSYVETVDNYVCFEGIPFCSINSQIARDYLIWADDGRESDRLGCENIILFNPRSKSWEEKIPEYDDFGNITGYRIIIKSARFSPDEVKFMRVNFSQLLEKSDVIIFNSYFYHGSDIKEIESLASYLYV